MSGNRLCRNSKLETPVPPRLHFTRFSNGPITRSLYNRLRVLGLYISVPFCRSKCSFCNFASGVFSRDKMNGYVARLQDEIAGAEALAASFGARFERELDSVYLGGGTPTTLS